MSLLIGLRYYLIVFTVACLTFPILAISGDSTVVLFRCPTSCKIYVDGKLLYSLPEGGLKQTSLPTGVKTTVLISRPGKPDWVHIIAPRKALSINPAESTPTEIPEDAADSATTRPSANSDENSSRGAAENNAASTHRNQVMPSWTSGHLFTTPGTVDTKRVQIKEGSHTCPEDIQMDVTLDIAEDGTGTIEYNQFMYSGLINNISDWCIDHSDDLEFNQNWTINAPIKLTKSSENVLAFTAVMSHCEKCKLPPGVDTVAGQVRRDGDKITLEFGEPLNITFSLEPFHSKNN